jgi:hypothetical protein
VVNAEHRTCNGLVRHAVDFGLRVTVMTQVVILTTVACSDGFILLSPKWKLNRGFNMRSRFQRRFSPVQYAVAMRFPRPVTRIFVPPLETPAACHVHLAATTLKTCETLAEYRIRRFLPYILLNTPQLANWRKARRMPKRLHTRSGRRRAGPVT